MYIFLKKYYKFNLFLSLLLSLISVIIFVGFLFDITPFMNLIHTLQEFSTFGLINSQHSIYLTIIGTICAFGINKYFYKMYITLYHFDRFKEISGLWIIIATSTIQLAANFITLGLFACIPLCLNIISMLLLHFYQKKKNQIIADPQTETLDPLLLEMNFKIDKLRDLKSQGKISEEEFMSHLNNILDQKE